MATPEDVKSLRKDKISYHGSMRIDSRLKSIHELYMAVGRGEVSGFTVPAFNLRGMTEELAQGIFEAAKITNTGAIIFEIARSEMEYTGQSAYEFVRRVIVGADKAFWKGPIFVQADHSQVKTDDKNRILNGELDKLKKLIQDDIEAGFYNIDIDASTLVDVSLPSITEQQKTNASVTAELAKYIRNIQPENIQISIGGEIGHIGDRNSTEEDLVCFDKLFKNDFGNDFVGLSKVSVQTGTSHGGNMLSDGTMREMNVDFSVIEKLAKVSQSLGMGGVVQHGASTLPENMFGKFPESGAIEIHLSTGWQNMIMDHPDFPTELKTEMYKWLDINKKELRKSEETDIQFYYRTRKYVWGEFRKKLEQVSQDFKTKITNEMKDRCIKLFRELKVENTIKIVDKYINNKQNLRVINQVVVKDKRVIVRVDWNVTLGKAMRIVDDTRIVRTLPTIKWLLDNGAKQIILMSHLGKAEEKRSIKPVAKYASELIGEEIHLLDHYTNKPLDHLIMLENLRLWEGEDSNDDTFARQLAVYGDIYVNEAFGECHRESASIVGIPKYLPSYAGLWLMDEMETIGRLQDEPERPYIVIMGGAKVDDKLKLIEKLADKADIILLGGKLANEYIQKKIQIKGKAKILTPIEGSELLDIGVATQELYAKQIANAKTIVWNGPMGKVEDARYFAGTQAIYEAIVKNEKAYTVVGGGDTLSAIGKEEHLNRIDHVSTGGGAMLKLLETGRLVGVEVLKS